MLWKCIFPIVLLLSGISCSHYYDQKNLEEEGCYSIPLTYFSFSERAIAQVEIENEKYSLLVDLGAGHPFMLQKRCLDKIQNKTFLGQVRGFDVKGNAYSDNDYQVPFIKIGKICGEDVPIQEKSQEFLLKGCRLFHLDITDRERKQIEYIDGSIGNTIFQKFVCLFDFDRSVIYLSKKLDSFDKNCSLEEYTEVPFETNSNGFIILNIETDFGLKRMLLDSGASHSILKESHVDKKYASRIEEHIWHTTSHILKINGYDFGEWDFFLYEFPDPMGSMFDAILGVDFFKDHIICIDYQNNKAYIKALNKPLKKMWKKVLRIFG